MGGHVCDEAGSCESLFGSSRFDFLKAFKGGPADLDLVFQFGDGFAYFFKVPCHRESDCKWATCFVIIRRKQLI